MLIQDFIQVPLPQAQVCAEILTDPAAFFGLLAGAAYADGERLSLRLTASSKHPRVGKRAQVDVGQAVWRGDRLVIPLHWWASGATALFPRLEADLEIAPLGSDATEITLMGRYDPPLAAFGRGADRLLMHRVAEASVRSFLTRVGSAVVRGEQIPAVV